MKHLLLAVCLSCSGCAREVPAGFEQACEVDGDCPEGFVCADRFEEDELECQIPCDTRHDCPNQGARWLCSDGMCDYTFAK